MVASDPSFDRLVTDRETVRRVVRQHGGQPVVRSDDGTRQLAIAFPGDDYEAVSSVAWDEFLDRFEAAGLALALAGETEPATFECALVERDRDEFDVPADGDEKAPSPKARDRDVPPDRNYEGEGQAEERSHQAEAEANADAHRDEPPFQS